MELQILPTELIHITNSACCLLRASSNSSISPTLKTSSSSETSEYPTLFLCQRLHTATSSTADDVDHYVIPQKLLDSTFNKLPVFIRQWEKGSSSSGRSPAPIADSFHVAAMVRKHSVLNLLEINKENTNIALASVLTYYG
jgi:hypothetical protein